MTRNANLPPPGEPWVWQTRELMRSDAWKARGINVVRLIDFLLVELMNHGGKDNGKLKATHRQLEDFGVGARYVAEAIRRAEELGLIECQRGGQRVATTYALTWMPLHDGTPASNQWQAYRSEGPTREVGIKSRNLPYKGRAGLPYKGRADGPNLPPKGKADHPKTLPYKGKALLEEDSYQGADDIKDLSAGPRLRVVEGGGCA